MMHSKGNGDNVSAHVPLRDLSSYHLGVYHSSVKRVVYWLVPSLWCIVHTAPFTPSLCRSFLDETTSKLKVGCGLRVH